MIKLNKLSDYDLEGEIFHQEGVVVLLAKTRDTRKRVAAVLEETKVVAERQFLSEKEVADAAKGRREPPKVQNPLNAARNRAQEALKAVSHELDRAQANLVESEELFRSSVNHMFALKKEVLRREVEKFAEEALQGDFELDESVIAAK